MKFILIITLLLFTFTGCGQRIQKIKPVEVSIPVAIPCSLQKPLSPDWNIPHLGLEANAVMRLKAAFADLELSRGYIEELEAELAACS